jgi:low affinity Fe/Cu permease
MLNAKDFTKRLKQKEEIEAALKKCDEDMNNISNPYKDEIDKINSELNQIFEEIKKWSMFDRIAEKLKLGKKYQLNINFKKLNEEKEKAYDRYYEYENNTKKELESRKKALEKMYNEYEEVPEYIEIKDGNLVITDKSNEELQKFDLSNEEFENEPNKILVHVTNFFPKNHTILNQYSANVVSRTTVKYNGIDRYVPCLLHRHTTHFTVNTVVSSSHGYGNWDDCRFVIIDGYKEHENELHGSKNDAWIIDNVKLSKNATILVNINDKEKLKNENLEDYNIIYYNGERDKCFDNYLRLNQYKKIENESTDKSHSKSISLWQERMCNKRDAILNFISNNKYLSRDIPIITQEEAILFFDVLLQNVSFTEYKEFLQQLPERYRSYDDTQGAVEELIQLGFHKTSDNMYTFDSDEKIRENIQKYRECQSNKVLINFADTESIDELLKLHPQFIKRKNEKQALPEPDITQVFQMKLSDIYKFENMSSFRTLENYKSELCAKFDCLFSFREYDNKCTELKSEISNEAGATINILTKFIESDKTVQEMLNQLLAMHDKQVQEFYEKDSAKSK